MLSIEFNTNYSFSKVWLSPPFRTPRMISPFVALVAISEGRLFILRKSAVHDKMRFEEMLSSFNDNRPL